MISPTHEMHRRLRGDWWGRESRKSRDDAGSEDTPHGCSLPVKLELIDIHLVTPDKHRLSERPASEVETARIRLVIESVFSNLKRQMRLEHHLAKTLPGLAQRIAQRLLALTLGMLLNTILRRPLRSLVGRTRSSPKFSSA